jgi:hypothetical protein
MFGCAVVPARPVQGATLTLRKQRSPGLCRAVPALKLQICRTSWATQAVRGDVLTARCVRPEVLYIPGAGTGDVMSSETIVAASGLVSLGAAVITGAIWDSPLVAASARLLENLRSQGRHAMPR